MGLFCVQKTFWTICYVKAKIYKTQSNSRWKLCCDRDEPINHIRTCSKLAQKEYKTRHAWVDKVIQWELCKKLKFDYTNEWYMHNQESIQENETKLLRNLKIQADHLISARQPDSYSQ